MTWLPSALLFACFGAVATLAAAGLVVCWLARYAWAALVALRTLAVGLWWPPVAPRPAVERYPAPDRPSARADLDAAFPELAAQVQHLNGAVDSAVIGKTAPAPAPVLKPRKPKRSEIRRLIEGATNACRDAATHKP